MQNGHKVNISENLLVVLPVTLQLFSTLQKPSEANIGISFLKTKQLGSSILPIMGRPGGWGNSV
jgi:hypothetical protein